MEGTSVRRFINVFVNEDNIRDKKELDTELKNGDTVSILPSIAGGIAAEAGTTCLHSRGCQSVV